MKRRTLVEYEDASPEVQAIYEEIREVMGSPAVPNFLKALGNNENVLRAIWLRNSKPAKTIDPFQNIH
jgi:hypothetical protein